MALKADLKREQNQRYAVEKSRAQWREKAKSLDRQIRQLQQELAEEKTPPGQSPH
jgi:hypothetical protein